MRYLGIIGQSCRIANLRGLALYASKELESVKVPASECAFGACASACCSDGCRLCYEDIVELGPYMAAVSQKHGLTMAGFKLRFIGEQDEPGYESLRGFLDNKYADVGCVLQDSRTKGCLLHSEALAQGLDWRRMKPFTCVLYPVRMKHAVDDKGSRCIVLKPSREHSICPSLTHLKDKPRSTKSYLEAKCDDIAFLFALESAQSMNQPAARAEALTCSERTS